MSKLRSIDPATGARVVEIEEHNDRDVEDRLSLAHKAFSSWRKTSFSERARVLSNAADILENERESFGKLMTQEMGKTLASAMAESVKCASACRYYAGHGADFISSETIVATEAEHGSVRYDPLGIVLAVMPWNFPFWQVVRFAAPALAAGNVALLKHASNVPRSAIALEELFRRAGAPEGVFQTLLIGSSRVDSIIADPRIRAVTLTGSEGAGRSVAATAGKYLKPVVLELGGSDAFIVTDSADLDRAAALAVAARLVNNGQSCIAAKRFIVTTGAADGFLERFTDRMKSVRVGNPIEAATVLGPLAMSSLRDDLHRQVSESVSAGAKVLTGGEPVDAPGFYFQPTVLADIPTNSPAHDEELFGPVATVFRARDAQHAVALANDSRFGLAASVWTQKRDEADYFARELECGTVFVNEMVASDPRFPFGGVKASGYGRELGVWGLREFVNVKTVREFGLPKA